MGLGNATPRQVEIDTLMGRAEIDLTGAWRRDAEIDLESRMASGFVRVAADVILEGLSSAESIPHAERNEELSRPRLRFVQDDPLGGFRLER
jgi:hypothetical protein